MWEFPFKKVYSILFTGKPPKANDKGLFARKIDNYFRVCKCHKNIKTLK